MKPTNPIFRVFGQSPIRPLQKHMEKVRDCARVLMSFFSAVLHHEWENAKIAQQSIVDLEHDADNIKNDLRSHLPKSLFMPFSRSDLLDILTLQDNIANKAKDIAGIILGRHMCIPPSVAPRYLDLLKRCIEATEQANLAVNELSELLETGFRGAEVNIIESMIKELHVIEHNTDEIQVDVRHELFIIESTLNPVDVVFLYKVIQWTGDLADDAQQVGNRLQLLLAK